MLPGHLGPATRGNAKGREGLQAGPEVGNHRHTGAGELGGGGQTIRAARRVEPLTAVLQGGKGSEAHDIPDERVEARGREGEPEVGAGDGGERFKPRPRVWVWVWELGPQYAADRARLRAGHRPGADVR